MSGKRQRTGMNLATAAVDLIDVNRVERILVQALEQEAMPPIATAHASRPLRPSRLRIRPG